MFISFQTGFNHPESEVSSIFFPRQSRVVLTPAFVEFGLVEFEGIVVEVVQSVVASDSHFEFS
jgi:hypothetical protein